MMNFFKKDFLLISFFFIIILSILDNQVIVIENLIFTNIGINRVNLKWASFILTIFLGVYLLLSKKKSYYYLAEQKYFIIFLIYILIYSFFNFYFFSEVIFENFEKIKTIFKLNERLTVFIYVLSKTIYWLSLLAIFLIFFNIIEKYNKNKIEKFFLLFFILFLFLNIFYQFSLNYELNFIIKNLGSYSRDFISENFVGKEMYYENGQIIFINNLHERYTGTFREPSYLAFYSSIIFFVSFNKKFNNLIIILIRIIAAHLIFATVSLKILPFFLLMLIYLSILIRDKKTIFIYYLSPFIIAFIFNLIFFDHSINLINKCLYYLNVFFPDFFKFVVSLIYDTELSVLIKNFDSQDKLATGTIIKSENLETISIFKLIFGVSLITNKLENFYLLFLGKSAIIHTYYISGVFIFLVLYQFCKNIFVINNREILQNSILLIYIYKYFYFTKDTFQIDLILIYMVAYINSKNEFKYTK